MLVPTNRYLIVDPIEEHIRDSGVLIPNDVVIDDAAYKTVTLLAPNDKTIWPIGTRLLVPAHVLEEVSFLGEKYYLLLENHVMAYEFA